MRAAAYSAQRSGLLMSENIIDATGYLTPSPLMDELADLVTLDESLYRAYSTTALSNFVRTKTDLIRMAEETIFHEACGHLGRRMMPVPNLEAD